MDVPRVSGISGAGQGTHDEGFNPAGVFVTPFILRSPAHELRPNPSSPDTFDRDPLICNRLNFAYNLPVTCRHRPISAVDVVG